MRKWDDEYEAKRKPIDDEYKAKRSFLMLNANSGKASPCGSALDQS